MIALTGQLGGIAAAFSRALGRTGREEVVALARSAACGWGVDRWRLGSMTSERDTENMLSDVSTVYYFCLTPPSESRTHEGLGCDVALCDAMNFASVVSKKRDVRVVLVTRMFPNDGRNLGSAFAFWREIKCLFEETIPHLQVVQIAPIWSEYDVVTMGALVYAKYHHLQERDVRFFNFVNPASMSSLTDRLVGVVENWQDGATHVVEGEIAVSYGNLVRCIQGAVSGKQLQSSIVRMISRPKELGFNDSKVFLQCVEFHTASDEAIRMADQTNLPRKVFDTCREFVSELGDASIIGAACMRIGAASRDDKARSALEVVNHSRNYVYRIARSPRRSVSEIAELFIVWLPRYFQRLIHLESLGDNRQMIRVARVPLVELEKTEESWQRCRLMLRWPWGNQLDARARLIVTVTGTREKARELLIVVEDGPNASWFVMMCRGIMSAFGKYLCDYGVAE